MFLLKQILKVGLIGLIACQGAFAITSDNEQPIHINSDTFTLDYKSGIATYNGHVNATQGTRELTGSQLVVTRDSQGNLNKITLTGTPAKFRGLAQVGKPMVHAQALTMIYAPQKNLFTLEGSAQIAQNGNISKAPVITYDTESEVVNTLETPDQRSSMILQPYNPQQ